MSNPPTTVSLLTRAAAELVAQDFILDRTELTDVDSSDRVQVWNLAVDRLRKFWVNVSALPAIRSIYAADK
jgi:hypothetical protein